MAASSGGDTAGRAKAQRGSGKAVVPRVVTVVSAGKSPEVAPPRAWWRVLISSRPDLPPGRLELGLQAQRSRAIACALLLFIVGFSLDDLRVLRIPGYLVGVVGALVVWAFGPLHLGRRFAHERLDRDQATYESQASRSRRLGALGLLASLLLFAAWLVVFSSGVPPWAR